MTSEFTPMSDLIGRSFIDEVRRPGALPGRDEEPALAGLSAWDLPRLAHDPAVPLERQDELLSAVVRCSRREPHPSWSAVILEMLAPMLTRAGARFFCIPVGVSREDLDQQLMTEALHAARFMQIPSREVQRRLRRRIMRRTIGWLLGTLRSEVEPLEQVEREGPRHRDLDQRFLTELAQAGVSPETLDLLYRSHVLGVTVRELAIEVGISTEAVRQRMRRGLRRLRKQSPTKFGRFLDEIEAAA